MNHRANYAWSTLLEEEHDWYPPREVRVEICDGLGRQMLEWTMAKVALGVAEFQHRVPIVLCGPDPMRHERFAEVVDTVRAVDPWIPVWVETIGSTLTGDSETRTPDRVFVHVANRLAELLEAKCNVVVFRRDPRTDYIWRCADARRIELADLVGVRITSTYPVSGRRDHTAREVCLLDSEPPPTALGGARALLESRCMQPHTTMVVRWDGTVPLCREDVSDEVYMGSLSSSDLHDIWYSDWFRAARARAWAGLRDLGPCRGCLRATDRRSWLNHHALASRNPADEEAERQIRRRIDLAPR